MLDTIAIESIPTQDFWTLHRKAEGLSVKKYREKHGISRQDVASRLKVSQYALTRYEKGFDIQGRKQVSKMIRGYWQKSSLNKK